MAEGDSASPRFVTVVWLWLASVRLDYSVRWHDWRLDRALAATKRHAEVMREAGPRADAIDLMLDRWRSNA